MQHFAETEDFITTYNPMTFCVHKMVRYTLNILLAFAAKFLSCDGPF